MLSGGRVGGREVVVAECVVRDRHPFVDLGGLVSRLLRAVLPQRRLQHAERVGMPPLPHQQSSAGMCGPRTEARRSECFGTGFQLCTMPFGFVESTARQGDVDRTTQQTHTAECVLARQRDPQLVLCGLWSPACCSAAAPHRAGVRCPRLVPGRTRRRRRRRRHTTGAPRLAGSPLPGRPAVHLLQRPG